MLIERWSMFSIEYRAGLKGWTVLVHHESQGTLVQSELFEIASQVGCTSPAVARLTKALT
jgi:hypothetical protein